MNCLTSTLFLLIALFQINAITIITPTDDNNNNSKNNITSITITSTIATPPLRKSSSNIQLSLNQTERYRRLIPYMAYYVPTNDYYPVNQAYSYNMQSPKQVVNQYQQQQQQQQLNNVQQTQQQQQQQQNNNIKALQQQPNNRPVVYNQINNNYANQRPQVQAIQYNTRHQPHKPYESQIEQQQQQQQPQQQQQKPQRINYLKFHQLPTAPTLTQKVQKDQITPFLLSNQVPGTFRPLVYQETGQSYQQNNNFKKPYKQEVAPIEEKEEEILQYYQQPAPPPPQQQQSEEIYHQEYIQQNEALLQNQQEKQQIFYQKQQNKRPDPQVQSTPKPFYAAYDDQSEKNYVNYVQQPETFVQFIKSTPTPPVRIQQYYKMPPTEQSEHLYKSTPSPIKQNHQIIYAAEEPEQEIPEYLPPAHKFRAPQNEKPQYTNIQYNLDPDDGYDIRVPPQYIPQQLIIPKLKKNPGHNSYVSTMATPVTTYTPKQKYVSENSAEYVYEDLNKQIYRPTISTPSIRQHLTETTHIQPPTITTFTSAETPAQSPPPSRRYQSHQKSPKLKLVQHIQPQPVKKVPIIIAEKPNVDIVPISVEDDIYPHHRLHHPQPFHHQERNNLPNFDGSTSLSEVLKKLQETNLLPQTLNAGNIDDSIQTLVKILNNLKQSQHVAEIPSQHHPHQSHPHQQQIDYDYGSGPGGNNDYSEVVAEKPSHESTPYKDAAEPPGPNTGKPGVDYPALYEIPQTSFNCKEQRYKGFFGDPETNCQVWHYCDLNGGQASFLCPNGTIFSQVALTCDWWFNVKCSTTTQLYVLNERLYKYILPFSPKFPEDYSGPVVDKYLAIKFQEMEEKMRKQKQKGKDETTKKIEVHNDKDEDVSSEDTSRNPSDPQIDDEGQSHNVDSAVQYASYEDSNDGYNQKHQQRYYEDEPVGNSLSTTTQQNQQRYYDELHGNSLSTTTQQNQHRYYEPHGNSLSSTTTTQSTPTNILPPQQPRPTKRQKVEIESEKVEVIEIKSDGSTGHLVPAIYNKH